MSVLDRTKLWSSFSRLCIGLSLAIAVMALNGCASNAPANDPELAARSLGDVTQKIAERNTSSGETDLIKAYADYDETRRCSLP